MSYTKEGYEHMASEILNDFNTVGLFIDPLEDQHYTSKTVIFKSKIMEVISSEISIMILKNVIDSPRYKEAAIEVIETMLEHSMFQKWVKPENLQLVVEYLRFYIDSKCQSSMQAKKLYEKAKEIIDQQNKADRGES